jgi:hypothetical protein
MGVAQTDDVGLAVSFSGDLASRMRHEVTAVSTGIVRRDTQLPSDPALGYFHP